MHKKYWLCIKNLGKISSAVLVFTLWIQSAIAQEIPIDRNFLQLPDDRWIWLQRVDYHTTRIILGHGEKRSSNALWKKTYEISGEKQHTWANAYFVKLHEDKFFTANDTGDYKVGVTTFDFGNNMLRSVTLFRIGKSYMEEAAELHNFDVALDGNVFD